ncbi:6-hydroxy-D-nicotine oxidase [Cladorrhinum sp. PSN259]|nr:6-hydroxy-D-nicotine oxidase [Cladorrhinum sp. PSN259]
MNLPWSLLLVLVAFASCRAHEQNPARQPLFSWEQRPLTAESLANAVKDTNTGDHADLFAFGNGSPPNPDRLKSGACKVFPGDAQWPSQSTWDAFNKVLGGALIRTVPLVAPCYQNTGLYDADKCAAITGNYTNAYLHENDPTSTFWPLYQGRTCMPTNDPTSGNCTHGGYPIYAVNVSNVAQIQLAINFARNNNLRLVIKNTGHCYLGKSGGAGALSIWTHNLNDITYFPHLDISGYSGPAMKIAPGATVRQVYQAAHANNVSVLGGICESVGYAGGYIAGGGHTPLSGLYGMAADHVFALELVTASGEFLTASPTQNPDLFWALRGGGGSTFGVVTSLIIRVHPKVPVVTSVFSFGTSDTVSADAFWQGIRSYFEHFIPFTDAGTYSWFNIVSNTTNGNNSSYTFRMNPFFAPNHTVASFNALVAPWFDTLRRLGIPFTPNTTLHEAYYPAWHTTWGSDVLLNGAGRVFVPGNWLLPRRNWESPSLLNETFAVIRRHSEAGRVLRGYHQAPRNRANADNAVNSAFRQVICFLILSGTIPPTSVSPTREEIAAASKEMREEILGPLKRVAPVEEGGGAYLNEANVDEEAWQGAFYGRGYERLKKIKEEWDPAHVFYATTAVGSEGWEVRDGGKEGVKGQDGRLCRA